MGNTESSSREPSMIVKKGLLIGINYIGTNNQLNGCINDSLNLKEFLKKNSYLGEEDFVIMNDNEKGDLYPSKENIIKKLDELVKFCLDNSDKEVYLFVSYSGHGYFLPDYDGDESDGKDEVLCPADCNINGYIRDDTIKAEFIDKLPENVHLFVLIDSCHSGTMCDLKFNYNIDASSTFSTYGNFSDTKCDVIMISGCEDKDVSSDAYIYDSNSYRYEYQGAMTASFVKCFYDEISYQNLIEKMRSWLKKNRFTQIPQLSSGKYIDINNSCLLSKYDKN